MHSNYGISLYMKLVFSNLLTYIYNQLTMVTYIIINYLTYLCNQYGVVHEHVTTNYYNAIIVLLKL